MSQRDKFVNKDMANNMIIIFIYFDTYARMYHYCITTMPYIFRLIMIKCCYDTVVLKMNNSICII